MHIRLPDGVVYILESLSSRGFEGYAVGGCVRDSLLGLMPGDWDICTSALPHEVESCFQSLRVIGSGLKHGTVTIFLHGESYEVTTFRSDGYYSDGRHPDNVKYVGSLFEDLSRRDFTINAMAYNPTAGLLDYFGGTEDLKNKIIRTVGDPDKRFKEDSLRILRALRFSSNLGLTIESKTALSIRKNKNLLTRISPERICKEFSLFLLGASAAPVLSDFHDVISVFIPELSPEFCSSARHSSRLAYNFSKIGLSPVDLEVRLCLLLGQCRNTKEILKRLRYDGRTIDAVYELVRNFNEPLIPDRRDILLWLNRLGEKRFRQLVAVKMSCALANQDVNSQEAESLYKVNSILDDIIKSDCCFSIQKLAINGHDLISHGIEPGPMIGLILARLLQLVIDGKVENKKRDLLNMFQEL